MDGSHLFCCRRNGIHSLRSVFSGSVVVLCLDDGEDMWLFKS